MENVGGCAEVLLRLVTSLVAIFSFSFSAPTAPETSEVAYSFVLAEEGVDYSFRETLNCQFVIAGDVELLNENVIARDLVIMVQPLGTYDDRPAAMVNIGTHTEFGQNGWSQLFVGNYWYLVWVHDLKLGVPLSDEILVDDLDCANDRTLALVNFQQVLPVLR